MIRPVRIEYPGAVYHDTSRGDRREPIAHDDIDRAAFLSIAGQAFECFDAHAGAYCLMGTHYHLVTQTAIALAFDLSSFTVGRVVKEHENEESMQTAHGVRSFVITFQAIFATVCPITQRISQRCGTCQSRGSKSSKMNLEVNFYDEKAGIHR